MDWLEQALLEGAGERHTLITIGKGGVGKTTFSIMAGLLYSRHGRSLVASLDPAKHLLEYLGLPKPLRRVEVAPGLEAVQYDIEPIARKLADEYAVLLRRVMPGLTVLNLDDIVKSVRYAPGFEEEVFLRILQDLYKDEAYRYTVIDTPPTGVTHRLLNLPNLYMFWVERLYELRLKIVSLRYAIARAMGRREKPRDPVLDKLEEMHDRYKTLWAQMRDPSRTSIAVVATPEPLPIYEAQTTLQLARELGIRCRLLVVNRILAKEDAERLGLAGTQAEAIRRALEMAPEGCRAAGIMQAHQPPRSLEGARSLLALVRPLEEIAEDLGVQA